MIPEILRKLFRPGSPEKWDSFVVPDLSGKPGVRPDLFTPGWEGLREAGMFPVLAEDTRRMTATAIKRDIPGSFNAASLCLYHLLYGPTPFNFKLAKDNLPKFIASLQQAGEFLKTEGQERSAAGELRAWTTGWSRSIPGYMLDPRIMYAGIPLCEAVVSRVDHSFVYGKPQDQLTHNLKAADLLREAKRILLGRDPLAIYQFAHGVFRLDFPRTTDISFSAAAWDKVRTGGVQVNEIMINNGLKITP